MSKVITLDPRCEPLNKPKIKGAKLPLFAADFEVAEGVQYGPAEDNDLNVIFELIRAHPGFRGGKIWNQINVMPGLDPGIHVAPTKRKLKVSM